jgi:very-short-patch-repair endonuclease
MSWIRAGKINKEVMEDILNPPILEAFSGDINELITDEFDPELIADEHNPDGSDEQIVYKSHKYHLKNRQISHFEVELGNYLESFNIPLVPQVKVYRWIFDFAIPNTDILIEADGTYWHGLEESHQRDNLKNKWCRKNGYDLYRIDENEFNKDKYQACKTLLDKVKELPNGTTK